MAYIDDSVTIRSLLERRAATDPEAPYCRFGDSTLTLQQIDSAVNRLANGLVAIGVEPGYRVAVMLPNHPDHVVTMLALLKIGAVWVPVNLLLRGPSLSYLLEHADPQVVIADVQARDALKPIFAIRRPPLVVWRGADELGPPQGELPFSRLYSQDDTPPPLAPGDDSLACIIYTSGTTGPPKGVLVTDKMLRASALGASLGGEIRDGDVLLLWEPLYHIGGIEVVILGLMQRITFVLVERFSASRFWDQVRAHGVTHIHHLGGILQILLKQPSSSRDLDNLVRISWGGGCTAEVWRAFEQRFGVEIHEVYGMTEASSISTINMDGRVGSIGKAVPFFEVAVLDDDGKPVPPGAMGEIVITEREPGLITRGYFRNPEATAEVLRDGKLFTGDLARLDADGFLFYAGRKRDSVRHRGENVSAWEVERVVNEHPDVEESAMVGVETDVGEQDLKLFVRLVPGRSPDPTGLIRWCEEILPHFQVPRYLAFVDQFEKTPSLRIRKEMLSRSTTDCWDRERPRDHDRLSSST